MIINEIKDKDAAGVPFSTGYYKGVAAFTADLIHDSGILTAEQAAKVDAYANAFLDFAYHYGERGELLNDEKGEWLPAATFETREPCTDEDNAPQFTAAEADFLGL